MQTDSLTDALCKLVPISTTQTDPLAVAYELGRRSARGRTNRWRVATVAMALLALTSLLPRISPPGPPPGDQSRPLAAAEKPAATQVAATPKQEDIPPENIVRLRDAMLAGGLDALPRRDPTMNRKVPTVGGSLWISESDSQF